MNSKAPIDWSENWQILGNHGLRSGRYTDPAFARLEHQRLWSRVWQAGVRLDEIPETGYYTTYDIGDQSVMLVRVDADTVKAYHNACPHRGTALSQGCGSFPQPEDHLPLSRLALGSRRRHRVYPRAPGVPRR